MNELGFVGRERELTRLQSFLDKSLAGSGQIVFISGDAGSGKTALLRQFAIDAEQAHQELVIAVGNCNAQTGVGDPYLPFREVLTLLTTGDVEGRLSQGSITPENADRLRKLVSRSVQVLVEVGPDLVEVLVPGAKLLGAVGKAVAEKVGWVDNLERLAQRKPGQAGSSFEQTRLFEQYTNVIKALANEQPLLVVVDDLHWADAGSVSLLFHLARRIERSKIMLVGTYRPYEVALGRGDARHPMESVLNELQRYHGEITIDLEETVRIEGRSFAEALLDTQPNQLSPQFREALYRHTGGHPLFTVELLYALTERGDLMRNEQGLWVEGPNLDWSKLPARVEGVIAERLDRLEEDLYNILCVASVEGIDFTAQVIARVEQLHHRQLLQSLSHELERRHGLVRERGETQIERKLLWRYQFAHALFQQYLYEGMSAGERRLLHGEVALALEELYAGRVMEIAVQLARHYDEAGDDERAITFLIEAGDAATRLYAYAEARLHYEKALDHLQYIPDTEQQLIHRIDTTIKLANVSILAEDPQRLLDLLGVAEQAARQLPGPDGTPSGDKLRLARVHYWMGRAHFYRGNPAEAVNYYREVLAVAKEASDEELIAIPSSVMGQAMITRGQYDKAVLLLAQALDPLETTGNWIEWIRCAAYYGIALAAAGRSAEALDHSQRAIARAEELKIPPAIASGYLLRAWVHFLLGDMPAMESDARQTIRVATQTGDALSQFAGHGELAWALTRQGRLEQAAASLARSKETSQKITGPLVLADLFAAMEVELALRQGKVEEALALAEVALVKATAAKNLFALGMAHRFWGIALATLEPPRWDEAEHHLALSLESLEEGHCVPEAARTHVTWGRLREKVNDPVGAREHFEKAITALEAASLSAEAERVRQRMAKIAPQP